MANWANKTCGYCRFVCPEDLEIKTCPVCGVDKCIACGQTFETDTMCKACALIAVQKAKSSPYVVPE